MAFLLTSPPPPPSLLHKNPNPTLLIRPTNVHSLSFSLLPKTTTTARFSSPNSLFGPHLQLLRRQVGQSCYWGSSRGCGRVGRESRARCRAAEEGSCRSLIRQSMQMSAEVKNIMFISGNDNGSVGEEARVIDDDNKLMELKSCLMDSVYGTDLGFRASAEVRVEVLKLINQLEATNPTSMLTEATDVLDENWVLV